MRLIIVSNRLPVSVGTKNGKIIMAESAGGLATGLLTYLGALRKRRADSDYLWVGWPGETISKELEEPVKTKLASRKLYPVYLSSEEKNDFYNGFCNDTLWPLFHSFPSMISYKEEQWQVYKRVNQHFARELLKIIRPGDIVWVHDYHLMLLPGLLREKAPKDVQIGFFLHTPFPVFEIYRLLPDGWRKNILQGILGADLVGFHTYDYKQYFLGCAQRILGYEHTIDKISLSTRRVRVDVFPVGIDFLRFYNAPVRPGVFREKQKLKKTVGGSKIILSLDRLDYSKGIEKRLKGFEVFLEKNPEWRKKVVLIMVAVPSRTEVPRYKEMKKEIDELVGRINGRFGSVDWTPILYQYRDILFEELSALYNLSDLALVTPLRDGMNLVAKEYVASRRDQTGVLILSETAGAACELGEAILINPNHVGEISDALKQALDMPKALQREGNRLMQSRLRRYDIVHWGDDFLNQLAEFSQEEKKALSGKLFLTADRVCLLKEFESAKKRLLLFDYDGCLVPFAKYPFLAQPSRELLDILARLVALPHTTTAVITGRDRKTIEKWLAPCGVNLSAEHGVWIKERGKNWKMTKSFRDDWKESILPLMRIFVDRVPGSFLEEKQFSLVWHYRLANPELASWRAKELTSNLLNLTFNMNVQVVPGNKIVEVRTAGTDKGNIALYFMDRGKYDFVLGLGDDVTDEDLFRALPERAWSIKVGAGQTAARHIIEGPGEVLALLERLGKGQGEI